MNPKPKLVTLVENESDAILSERLIARARDIAVMAGREAYETERNGKVSEAIIDACAEAQLFEVLTPKIYGGHELNCATMASIVYEFARHCTSTAWIVAFYMGHNFMNALWPKEFQDEAFANGPSALMVGTLAPSFKLTPVDGGYVANGRSQWNSGSSRCDWFYNSGFVMVDGNPQALKAFMVPAGEAEIIDNWDVAGMRGTSSSDVRLTNVFVPFHRAVDASSLSDGTSPGSRVHPNRLYSLPSFPVLMTEVAPILAGAYRGAADAFKKQTEERLTTYTSAKVAEKQTAQIRVGRGQAGAAITETLVRNFVEMVDGAEPAELRMIPKRAEIRAQVGMITEYAQSGINDLMLGAGAGAFRNTSPMQRFFRDINMLRTHAILDAEASNENFGRVLLGLEPNSLL